MGYVKAKKSLGQHFLVDQNIAKRIAYSIPDTNLPLLEIGPGMGMLTKFMLEQNRELKLVELDDESVEFIKNKFPEIPPENVIYGDFLKLDLRKIYPDQFGVIGNFPYNISSQILFKTLEYRKKIPSLCGMFQKEVAQRVVSQAGIKEYGILSVLIQTWYNAKVLFTVSEKVFVPKPKVQSAVILLQRKHNPPEIDDEKLYIKIVKAAFNQRRKMLKTPLSAQLKFKVDTSYNNFRAEQLSIEDYFVLYKEIIEQLKAQ